MSTRYLLQKPPCWRPGAKMSAQASPRPGRMFLRLLPIMVLKQTSRSVRNIIGNALTYLGILVLLGFFLTPILWIISMSFKTPQDASAMPPKIAFVPTMANYRSVLFGAEKTTVGLYAPKNKQFPRNLANSGVASGLSTLIALLLGTPAAYSLARFNFRFKKDLSFFVLSSRFLPPIAILIPFYIMFSRLKLLDNILSLIIVYVLLNLALVVWMLKGFLEEVPIELEEAARVDGCSRLGTMCRITLPLVAPGLAATTILCLLMSWNEFLFAIILTGNAAKTAPVAIYSFITFREIVWGSLAAAGTITVLPVLIFVLFVQKNLVKGLTAGAVK